MLRTRSITTTVCATRVSSDMTLPALVSLVCGYGFAVVVGHCMIVWVVDGLWEGIGWNRKQASKIRPEADLPKLVGFVERTLYVAALKMGKPEFVGVWLALKVAGQWKRWSEEVKGESGSIAGRIIYNIFLIGSGLSIAYAVVGAELISALLSQQWAMAMILPVALVAGTVVLHYLTPTLEVGCNMSGGGPASRGDS